MSNHAARFARDAPGVETADPLHASSTCHVYAARLVDGPDEVRIVTPAPDASADEQTAVADRLDTWASLDPSPGLSTVHGRGEEPRPWLAVTASGRPLPAITPLSVEDARSVMADVAEALRAGVEVDESVPVEPADVRVVESADGADAVGGLLDWPTRISETPAPYSPPETGGDPESAAVFQLGTLVYYAVTGQPPVEEGDESTLHEGRWPSPSFVNSDVAQAFDAVVEQALDPDPANRYDTPYEFKRALLFERQSTDGSVPMDGRSPGGASPAGPAEDDEGETASPAAAGDQGGIAGYSRRTALGVLGLGVIGAAGGAWVGATRLRGSETDEFPMFRFDAANTGYAPDAVGPTEAVTEAWSVDLGTPVRSSPVVAGGTVVVSGDEGIARGLDTTDGSERWQERAGVPGFISAAIGDGVAYIVGSTQDRANVITARDLADGSERWRMEKDIRQIRTPVLADDRLYVFGSEGVHAVDTDDERSAWTTEGVSVTSLTGAVSEETLYVSVLTEPNAASDTPFEDRHRGVLALDATDGSKRWMFDLDALVSSSPAVVDGVVYVGSDDDSLVAIDAEAGEERWRFETDGSVPASPAVTDHEGGTVYVGCVDGSVYAIDSERHEQRWAVDTGSGVISSPAVVSDTVYVGNEDGYVLALDADAGEERWRFETDGPVISSPAVVSNTVFVGSNDGHVYALTEP